MINFKKQDPVADAVKEILQQEALKGNQHKIDKNHNGKIDGEDFKILRKEKPVAEELKGNQTKIDKNHNGKIDSQDFKILRGEKKEVKKEEVEQIDELSKGTLGSYVKSAARDVGASRSLATDFERSAKSAKKPSMKDANTRLANRFKATAMKRHAGIGKAVERLTKEENELDEVAPPGFEGTVKAMKKYKDIDNPYALAWSMKNKGYKSHKKADGTEKNEEVDVSKTLKQFRENAFDWKKKPEPTPNGGSGVKQGTRYGGSKQKDKPEQDTDEKK